MKEAISNLINSVASVIKDCDSFDFAGLLVLFFTFGTGSVVLIMYAASEFFCK